MLSSAHRELQSHTQRLLKLNGKYKIKHKEVAVMKKGNLIGKTLEVALVFVMIVVAPHTSVVSMSQAEGSPDSVFNSPRTRLFSRGRFGIHHNKPCSLLLWHSFTLEELTGGQV